ncbi:hypothetical protein DFH11DRAFT_1562075 [Phellopilus nigrolimitatus]|nr:hypothetical protein DFH11DRAFT_1562075 [Phellopilus nigrolimitatus]
MLTTLPCQCNWTKDIDRCDRCAKHKILCAVAAESSGTGTGGYRRSASRQSTAPPAVQTVPSSSQFTMPHEVHVLNTHPPLSLRTAWPGVNPDDTFVFPNNLPGDDSANMPTDAGFSQYLSKASPPGAGGFSPSSLSQAAHAPSLGHPGYHISEGYLDTHTGSPAPYILGDPTLQTVQQYAYPYLLHNGSHPHNVGNEHVSISSGYVSNSQPPAQSPSYAGMYHQQSQYLFDARPPPSN